MGNIEIISVDDHLLEPTDLWQSRVPARYRDRAPRVVALDDGDHWEFEGKREPTRDVATSVGKDKSDFSMGPVRYSEMLPQCYDSVARLADMDRDGILASLCFPQYPGFAGRIFTQAADKDLALVCLKAYNDFLLEEWAGSAPGRYIPMVLIPLWDPAAAVAEITRTANLGARAIGFSENPARLKLPSIHDADRYWDPVFAAAQDAQMPLCMHIGSSSSAPTTSPDAPYTVGFTILLTNSQYALTDWLFSGVLMRFPELKIVLSEGGVGWIPWLLERCDWVWSTHGGWSGSPLTEPPSEYFRRHAYGCFIDDKFGASVAEQIGIDNLLVESDYPHTDTSFPNTAATLEKSLAHLDAESIHKICRGNAEKLFRFTPSGLGQR